ncbi:MAG: single-stranded DNA-binding protein [Saprospiraceae bacterium]|jgi:single-strand DNA-binding protein|nr:single-stranded DNA-binding protein [Lewinellaceae bacterium]
MINKVTLIGNLGADPEVRHLESGVQVARFSVATNESYKDKDGNFQQITEWHNVVCWRELAERAEKMLKKGMLVFVEGKISYRKYTTQEGQDRYVTDIVANTFRLLERREGGGFDSRFPTAEDTPAAKSGAGEIPVSEPANNGNDSAGDDLPF